jgi:hypothetical protein
MRLVRGVNHRGSCCGNGSRGETCFKRHTRFGFSRHARLNTNVPGSRPGTRGTSLIKRAEQAEKLYGNFLPFRPSSPSHRPSTKRTNRERCFFLPLSASSPRQDPRGADRTPRRSNHGQFPTQSPVRVRAMAIGEPASYACLC